MVAVALVVAWHLAGSVALGAALWRRWRAWRALRCDSWTVLPYGPSVVGFGDRRQHNCGRRPGHAGLHQCEEYGDCGVTWTSAQRGPQP